MRLLGKAAYATGQMAAWLIAGPAVATLAGFAAMGNALSLPLVLAATPAAVVVGAGPAILAASVDSWLRGRGAGFLRRAVLVAGFTALVAGLLIAPLFPGALAEKPASPLRALPFLFCASAALGGAIATALSNGLRRHASPKP